jgi:thiamine-phosphate pyrophosphorylase
MASEPPLVAGLYAIADTGYFTGAALTRAVEAALAGGARVVQYRDKGTDVARRHAEAAALAAACRAHGALFLINDYLRLAAEVGADGVHLGRDDPGLTAARAALGPGAIVGVSCYNELLRARRALAAGADYVAFGRFFPSRSKPQAVPATAELLRAARAELHIPIVAIGGITPENGGSLIAAGADALAVIEGLFAQPDIRAAAERYARLFGKTLAADERG